MDSIFFRHTRTRIAAGFFGCFVLLLMGGCASIRGMQEPVTQADLKQTVCPSQPQIDQYHRLTGLDAGNLRNAIIYQCVIAIDSRYQAFKVDLQKESVGSNLAGDILAFGLTTGAAVSTSGTAKGLAAAGAFVTGVRTTINKDVFYEATLPAIESSMDANRAVILTAILTALKSDPLAQSYSLESAGIDLMRYQNAGNIYVAISELNRVAKENAVKETRKLEEAQSKVIGSFKAVVLTPDVTERVKALTGAVRALTEADRTQLDRIAGALGLEPGTDQSFAEEQARVVAAIVERAQNPDPQQQEAQISSLEASIAPLLTGTRKP